LEDSASGAYTAVMTRLLLLLCLLLLNACTPGDDGLALQRDYLQRLDTALQGDGFSAFEPRSLSQYRLPPRRQRLLELPEIRIGLLDLLIAPALHLVFRAICKVDHNAFRLLLVFVDTKGRSRNGALWGGSSATPLPLVRRYSARELLRG
jgi:hypothetical protein